MGTLFMHNKIILIDPDVDYGEFFVAYSAKRKIVVDHYRSMLEVGFLGRFKQYQVAIVNSQLETMTGLELAEYFEKLLGNMPVIVLRNKEIDSPGLDIPKAVYRVIDKTQPAETVLNTALAAANEFRPKEEAIGEPEVY